MANFIEDTINFGFGLFTFSREKIEQTVEHLVETGKLERKDAQGFTRDLIQKGNEHRTEVRQMITEEIRAALNETGLSNEGSITKEDIRAIIREELANAKKD